MPNIYSYEGLPFELEVEGVRIFARYYENSALEPSNRTEMLLMMQLIKLKELEEELQETKEQLQEVEERLQEIETVDSTEHRKSQRKKAATPTPPTPPSE